MEHTADSPTSSAALPSGGAQVRAAEFVTRYVRRGTGSPVVLLDHPDGDCALWPELLDSLATGYRLFLPEAPVAASEARFAVWMRGFLDGIGLPYITLVAGGRFCIPALEFTLLESERVNRLVLVPGGWAEQTGLTGELATSARPGALPLLVVRRESPPGDALEQVLRFIALHTP